MKNPAEELVTAWLQECKGYFTINNVKVPRKGGGMGSEIDILATNKQRNVWIEVSVSSNPRCNHRKEARFKETVNDYLSDFRREDKKKKACDIFLGAKFEQWLVYGKLALTKNEVALFPQEMKKHGVEAISFEGVLEELLKLKACLTLLPSRHLN